MCMNQGRLVFFSLAMVVLMACGGKTDSDSNSENLEFLKVSAELKQSLPDINESLSSQSPEGIWRLASHSVSYIKKNVSRDGGQESPTVLDIDFNSFNQLLILIQKDESSANEYRVFKCDGYRGGKTWGMNGNSLSYEVISDNDSFSSKEAGELVLDNNFSLIGQDYYQYNDSNSKQRTNTVYAGVKISDSADFQEARDLELGLQVSSETASYQLSDNSIIPNCFSISQSKAQLKEYTSDIENKSVYNQISSSLEIEMMKGYSINAYEETIVSQAGTAVNRSSFQSNVEAQDIQLHSCSDEVEMQGGECLKSLTITKVVDAKGMFVSSKVESHTGEVIDVTFSYGHE